MKNTKLYDYECTLCKEYANVSNRDEWGVAVLWLNDKQGVEYNFCIEDGCNYSSIYKMYYDEEKDDYRTDYNAYEHYEVNFDNADWTKELEDAMYKTAKCFFANESEKCNK